MKAYKRGGKTYIVRELSEYSEYLQDEKKQSFSAGEKFGRAEELKNSEPRRRELAHKLVAVLEGQTQAIEAIAKIVSPETF